MCRYKKMNTHRCILNCMECKKVHRHVYRGLLARLELAPDSWERSPAEGDAAGEHDPLSS